MGEREIERADDDDDDDDDDDGVYIVGPLPSGKDKKADLEDRLLNHGP